MDITFCSQPSCGKILQKYCLRSRMPFVQQASIADFKPYNKKTCKWFMGCEKWERKVHERAKKLLLEG